MAVTQPKLAPDKNIYINVGHSLYAIYDCDTKSAYLKPNVIKFDKNVIHLPHIHSIIHLMTICVM